MAPKRRRILFVDRKLQGTLLTHAVMYWFYCLFSVCLIAMCWIILTTKPSSSGDLFERLLMNFGPALLGSVLLLPLVLMDCLRLSNRFAGPMIRVRRAMHQLAAGQLPAEVHPRDGDFWKEFACDLNAVIRKMDEAGLVESDSKLGLEKSSAAGADESSEEETRLSV